MKKFRGILTFIAALALTLVIVSMQLAWNLHSYKYLHGVAERTNTNQAVAAALPTYAATKLPNPDAAKAAFAQHVTPGAVQQTLDSLYTSITKAYAGKTDVVEIDISVITVPISASGYQIPPGTVFANDTVQVGGLAGVLRLAQRSIIPSLLLLAASLGVVVLLGIKRGVAPSIRNVLLTTCLLLGGLFIATLGVPVLVSSLVSSSGLDAALRQIVLTYINALLSDAGRYYVGWIIVLGIATVVLSITTGLVHRAQRPHKKVRKQKQMPAPQPEVKEL